MTFIITPECVKCGECVDICPVGAIVEEEEQFIITEDCIDCGVCLDKCPIDSIKGYTLIKPRKK
jgi:formate hydrogenlyase subunit 6/NADH:ubiquinone oxidoreductase subunit I